MAKHTGKGRRRSRGIVAIPFTGNITLSTLANGVVIKGSLFTNAFDNAFFAVSMDATWSIRDLAAGESPIDVGVGLNDYSVGEIAEKLNADEMNIRLNQIAVEQGRRKIRRVGVFTGVDETLENGVKIRTPLRFTIPEGGNLVPWARNSSGVANLATGSIVQIFGTLFGRWT